MCANKSKLHVRVIGMRRVSPGRLPRSLGAESGALPTWGVESTVVVTPVQPLPPPALDVPGATSQFLHYIVTLPGRTLVDQVVKLIGLKMVDN